MSQPVKDKLTREDWLKISPHLSKMEKVLQYHIDKNSEPIGYTIYKGGHSFIAPNDHFDVNEKYPVYDDGERVFVIGKDGQAYKYLPPKVFTNFKNK